MGDYRVQLHEFPYFVFGRRDNLTRTGLHTFAILAGIRICSAHRAILHLIGKVD